LLSFNSKQLVLEGVIFIRDSCENNADESEILNDINKIDHVSIHLLCDDDAFDDSLEIIFPSILLY
jgi:hypothetical protein